MRFGGHETFALREGWLHKGLRVLVEQPGRLSDLHFADWLGVGRNMGKSIRHWMLATGLAAIASGRSKDQRLKATDLGLLVYEHDPHFLQTGTWWALHVELVNSEEHAATWWWFFNRFALTRFDRATCLANLQAFLNQGTQRVPAQKTLQRDISCLISSYATPLPIELADPEDGDECPFKELDIMTYSRATGGCSLNTKFKAVPAEILGYAIAKSLFMGITTPTMSEVTIREAATKDGGPGKAFVFGSDAVFEHALKAEQTIGTDDLVVSGLAAERTIRLRNRLPKDWLDMYYRRVRENRNAA